MAEEVQIKTKAMHNLEDYVIAYKKWERGSFYLEVDPDGDEGTFAVIKKNAPMATGSVEKSFAIQVNPTTGDIIGVFSYDQKNLIHIIENYVVTVEKWERGSFYVTAEFGKREGMFSVSKKNMPIILGGDENSFAIQVDPKSGKVIGTFAYQ
jgi:hypothetical protein